MKPLKLVLVFDDGQQQEFAFSEPKPSKSTGKENSYAGGKAMVTDGDQQVRYQVGCNVTRLET